MLISVILLFVLGYTGIILEHTLNLDKTAIALLMAALCWTALAIQAPEAHFFLWPEVTRLQGLGISGHALWGQYIGLELARHLASAAQILFFLLGAMTIVELMDAHEAFSLVTDRIATRNARRLLWTVGLAAFFLSALLDNLTTAIVMTSLLRKLIGDVRQRMLFAGVVVIAANAGGAFSPIGDVTTTMLWIGGQVTALPLMAKVLIPSLLCLAVPLLIIQQGLPKEFGSAPGSARSHKRPVRSSPQERSIMLWLGIGALVFVPVFKGLTGLPPYLGMLLGLAAVWLVGQMLHRDKPGEHRDFYSASAALTRTDTSSVLFFLGILLAIGALESVHLLDDLARLLLSSVGRLDAIAYLIGLASAVIDNVPLVAATQGMFSLTAYPADHALWSMLAFSAGTGGSILIIGSAAGVAVMGMENIPFGWYLKKIGWPAAVGYTAGMGVLLLL